MGQVKSSRDRLSQVRIGQVWSKPVKSGQERSSQFESNELSNVGAGQIMGFFTQNFCELNIFGPKFFSDYYFCTQHFFGPDIFLHKISWTHFFATKII